MLLYTYREPADAPFDFCVRKVDPADDPDNHDWPFEFYNVREGGISYRAGVRDGDRVNAHCDYKESAQKKRRNWQDTTLEMLNDLSSETLRIIFVDKRIDLESEDDNIHMRKRRDFIAAKKSTLRNKKRLDELPKFLRKWDRNHRKSSSERSSAQEGNEVPSTPRNDVSQGEDAEGQDARSGGTPCSLSNEGEADSAPTSTRALNETRGAQRGSQSGDDAEFDATYLQMPPTSTEQNSGDAVSSEEGDKTFHVVVANARILSAQSVCAEVQKTPVGVSTPLDVADAERVSDNCNVDEPAVPHADTEQIATRSLSEQGEERSTAERGHWTANGQSSDAQTRGDGRASLTTSTSISSEADCENLHMSQRTALAGTKRCSSSEEIQRSLTSKRAKKSKTATNAWDVEAAAAFARQKVPEVLQCSDVQSTTASQLQVWFRDLLGRRFEGKTLTQLENAISTQSPKVISEQFGEFALWVAKQFAPDKPVLRMSDVSFANMEPSTPRDGQDPYEVTKRLKTDLDNIATTRSQLKEAKQQHLQASEECRLQSESKTSQLRDKGMELDSILRVLEEAEKMCQLEHEQGTEKVVSLKEELEEATRFMADILFDTLARDQAAAKCDLVEKNLAQAKREMKTKKTTAEAATYLSSFWEGLRDSVGIAQCQHEEYVQRQGASTQSYNALIQKTLGEIDGKLTSTLEEYFGTSFRVQEYASRLLEPLLRTRTEDERNLGGFLVANPTETGVTELHKLQGAVETARKQDCELVELLRKLREDSPASYKKHDGKLTEAHPGMWRRFLELNRVKLNRPAEQVGGPQEEPQPTSCCDDGATDRSVGEIREDEVAADSSIPVPHPGRNNGFDFADVGENAELVGSDTPLGCSEHPDADTAASTEESGCALM